ncbi:MAG: hypothetical protein QOJ35_2634 [Solirubrobacteraceae bacterium]|nr:hypothetical protein [Solirubrobacteraceae bacterium]
MATSEGISPRLRPLSLGEILDVSIKICLRHWRTLLKAVLVVVVPVQIVGTIVNADYTLSSFDFSFDTSSQKTPQQTLDELNQYLGGLAISTLLQVLAALLASAACLRAIAQAYLGEQPDWRASLAFAWRRLPSLLWLTLLYGLGVTLMTLLLVAPGVWIYVLWAFALPALLVEGVRGTAALRRSAGLVKGRWWRTFGVLAVGFILAGVVSTVVQGAFLVGIVVQPNNDVLVLVLSALSGIVGLAIGTPFQAALLAVVYFDLRVRKEGFDLELLARHIGGSVPAAGDGAIGAPLLPPAEAIDRTGAPYWPPPPGWKPPGSAGGAEDPPPEAASG